MSNLLKANYVICKTDKKRIIDSNDLIARKIEELIENESMKDQENEEQFDRDFVSGIKADTVELLLEDETQDISIEASEELLINARQEAEEILENARQEAIIIKEQGFKQGKNSGYEAGYSEGIAKANILEEGIKDKEKALEEAYEKEIEKIEPLLVDTIIEVIEKVLPIQLLDKKDIVLHLLKSALAKIDNSKEFIVRVSKEDAYFVKEKKEFITSKVSRAASVEIVEDMSLSKNQCMIETDGGIFDCSLDTQLNALVKELRTLSSM